MKEYNEILKDLRTDLEPKHSQREVGEKCVMTQSKLSSLECGKTEPNLCDLRALCRFYNVSADYILGLPDLPYPKR